MFKSLAKITQDTLTKVMTKKEDIMYIQPTKIMVNISQLIGGRGVLATADISAGELIERCPMVKMAWRSNYLKDPVIWQYLYSQRCNCNDCKNHGSTFYMVLGYGMIYNYQDIPNADWKFEYDKLYADVIANKDILKGEEIFVSYGSGYFSGDRNKITVNPKTDPIPDNIKTMIDDENDDEIFIAKMKDILDGKKPDSLT